MAKSKFEYVKNFEHYDTCLLNTWIVVRLDGRGFHKFSNLHNFSKPNDVAALNLMNYCAECTLKEFQDIILAYGQSDEYSFIFKRDSTLFGRRRSKIVSTVVSFFTSCYVFFWSKFIETPLQFPPMFDSRVILYPTNNNLRDYLSWRQADCLVMSYTNNSGHINNLYNTCFWTLVKSGLSSDEAGKRLSKTEASHKHDILFNEFHINYNNEPDQFKKGSILLWEQYQEEVSQSYVKPNGERNDKGALPDIEGKERVCYRKRKRVVCSHIDIIGDSFWEQYKLF